MFTPEEIAEAFAATRGVTLPASCAPGCARTGATSSAPSAAWPPSARPSPCAWSLRRVGLLQRGVGRRPAHGGPGRLQPPGCRPPVSERREPSKLAQPQAPRRLWRGGSGRRPRRLRPLTAAAGVRAQPPPRPRGPGGANRLVRTLRGRRGRAPGRLDLRHPRRGGQRRPLLAQLRPGWATGGPGRAPRPLRHQRRQPQHERRERPRPAPHPGQLVVRRLSGTIYDAFEGGCVSYEFDFARDRGQRALPGLPVDGLALPRARAAGGHP